MKYTIKLSKSFKKSFKKLDSNEQDLFEMISKRLTRGEILESRFKDHALKGEYSGFRECHIKPDLLLIYKKQDDILVLTCVEIGYHSELF